MLQNIKPLKLYAWEQVVSRRVEEIRIRQLKAMLKAAALKALTSRLPNILSCMPVHVYCVILIPVIVVCEHAYLCKYRYRNIYTVCLAYLRSYQYMYCTHNALLYMDLHTCVYRYRKCMYKRTSCCVPHYKAYLDRRFHFAWQRNIIIFT